MHAIWLGSPWRLRLAALALAAVLVALLRQVAALPLSGIENAAGDAVWQIGTASTPERRVVIVDIDEASLKAFGPWPWSRTTIAQLSQRLESAGAAVQMFDVLFDAPRDGDAELAAVWAGLPVVAGQIFSLDPQSQPRTGAVAGALAQAGCPDFAPLSHGYVGNASSLLTPHATVGHLTPRVNADGVVRSIPALVCHDGRAYPTLALAALWRATQPHGPAQRAPDWTWHQAHDEGEPPGPWGAERWLTSASLPGVTVPLDANGDLRVPYRLARRALISIPAHAVLTGAADLSPLRGTIALVGATAFGIGDVTATPLSPVASGVEVHAQTLAGLLDNRLPYTPRFASAAQVLACLVIAAVLLAVAVRRGGAPVKRLPIAGLLLAVGSYAVAGAGLLHADLWLPWVGPALFAVLASTALATAEHAITRAQRERLSAHLGSYLPAPVAERLAASDPSGSLQVDQRDVSVLVADIRNFSAFAALRPPQETAALLHAFYCIAVDVVEQCDGVVENVVGDSVLAVWNAYSPCADHHAQALKAAKELLRSTRALLSHPVKPAQDHLLQPLALGVGVESGTGIVGSFGPTRRRAHVALGEPVSVASRLQKMTQELSMPILIGPQMAATLPEGQCEALGDYLLEGLSRPYTLHAPADWVDLVPADQLWAGVSSLGLQSDDAPDSWAGPTTGGSARNFASTPLRDA